MQKNKIERVNTIWKLNCHGLVSWKHSLILKKKKILFIIQYCISAHYIVSCALFFATNTSNVIEFDFSNEKYTHHTPIYIKTLLFVVFNFENWKCHYCVHNFYVFHAVCLPSEYNFCIFIFLSLSFILNFSSAR